MQIKPAVNDGILGESTDFFRRIHLVDIGDTWDS
jgi:hypothetical protein